MENVKVSVIVPVYNVETYLEEALMSLKNQTLKEIEFLIINDGSTDNSQKIIEEIAQDDPRFRVFNVKNGGLEKPLTWVFQKQKVSILLNLKVTIM